MNRLIRELGDFPGIHPAGKKHQPADRDFLQSIPEKVSNRNGKNENMPDLQLDYLTGNGILRLKYQDMNFQPVYGKVYP